jgi:uncharacterized protein
MAFITASLLHDYLICPHKVWRDRYGPQEEKEKYVNPFIDLLWKKGVYREKEIICNISKDEYLDLSKGYWQDRFSKTLKAMRSGAPLIYQGVLHYKNMIGIPDLLQRSENGDYICIDIKSGRGFKKVTGDKFKCKKSYAVQICMYIELLGKLNLSSLDYGYIYDIDDKLILYSSSQPIGKKTSKSWKDFYLKTKNETWRLLNNKTYNKPALSGMCSLCPWFRSCKNWCEQREDLTKIFYLGRSKRDVLNKDLELKTVKQASLINIDKEIAKKKKNNYYLYKIGRKTLTNIVRRADILANKKQPVAYEKLSLAKADHELYFDIEDDPTQDFVYLHGIYYRYLKSEKYIYFLAEKQTKIAEKKAWEDILNFIRSLPEHNFALYYYSSYEKTTFYKLQKRYPNVASKRELDNLFSRKYTIDLYSQVILRATDWPLSSYSLKSIAAYIGFNWRDKDPSGANSILWYSEYQKDMDRNILKRILDYNEDDCKATMVIKDYLVKNTLQLRKNSQDLLFDII